ncbi:WG repeat-containing protein [Actinoplanes sichuanensis]|uniref:WG repeat-containing protein n=1 Tax=Actinoplanes sichuanensis TaxID=512349 RepID=A0ABW4A899_9ACTN|nr:WG repeat-containing protein [Actinoplanes sichuanensis]
MAGPDGRYPHGQQRPEASQAIGGPGSVTSGRPGAPTGAEPVSGPVGGAGQPAGAGVSFPRGQEPAGGSGFGERGHDEQDPTRPLDPRRLVQGTNPDGRHDGVSQPDDPTRPFGLRRRVGGEGLGPLEDPTRAIDPRGPGPDAPGMPTAGGHGPAAGQQPTTGQRFDSGHRTEPGHGTIGHRMEPWQTAASTPVQSGEPGSVGEPGISGGWASRPPTSPETPVESSPAQPIASGLAQPFGPDPAQPITSGLAQPLGPDPAQPITSGLAQPFGPDPAQPGDPGRAQPPVAETDDTPVSEGAASAGNPSDESATHGLGWLLSMSGLGATTPAPEAEPAEPVEHVEPEDRPHTWFAFGANGNPDTAEPETDDSATASAPDADTSTQPESAVTRTDPASAAPTPVQAAPPAQAIPAPAIPAQAVPAQAVPAQAVPAQAVPAPPGFTPASDSAETVGAIPADVASVPADLVPDDAHQADIVSEVEGVSSSAGPVGESVLASPGGFAPEAETLSDEHVIVEQTDLPAQPASGDETALWGGHETALSEGTASDDSAVVSEEAAPEDDSAFAGAVPDGSEPTEQADAIAFGGGLGDPDPETEEPTGFVVTADEAAEVARGVESAEEESDLTRTMQIVRIKAAAVPESPPTDEDGVAAEPSGDEITEISAVVEPPSDDTAQVGDVVDPDTVLISGEPETVTLHTEPVTVAIQAEPETVVISAEPDTVMFSADEETTVLDPDGDTAQLSTEPQTVTLHPEPETVAIIAEPEPETVAIVAEPEPETVAIHTEPEPETAAIVAEPEPETVAIVAEPEPEPEPEPVAIEPEPGTKPEPEPEPETVAIRIEPEVGEPETVVMEPEAVEPETVTIVEEPDTAESDENTESTPEAAGSNDSVDTAVEPGAEVRDEAADEGGVSSEDVAGEALAVPLPAVTSETATESAAGASAGTASRNAPPEAAETGRVEPVRQRQDQRAPADRRRADPEQILAAYPWAYDPQTLREQVDEPDRLWDVADRLTDRLEFAERDNVRAGLLSLRAVVHRIVGELEDALADGREGLRHAEASGELRTRAIAQARLAHVLQWRGEFEEADRLYADVDSAELPPRTRAEICELAGRSAYEQGRYLEAVNHFEHALDVRRGEDPELVERVELALDAISRRSGAAGWGPYPRTRDEVLGLPAAPVPLLDDGAGLWGYAAAVEPRFAEALPFAEGAAWVRRPDSAAWELIDPAGELIIASAHGYVGVTRFAEGLAWVTRQDQGGWFAIDRDNRLVVPAGGFEDAKPFRRGLAVVRQGGVWGAVDRHGRFAVTPMYQRFVTALHIGGTVDGFTDEGLAVVDAGDRFGVVDRAGRVVVEPVHAAVVIHPVAFLVQNAAGLWGALDRTGAPLVDMGHRTRETVVETLPEESRPVL